MSFNLKTKSKGSRKKGKKNRMEKNEGEKSDRAVNKTQKKGKKSSTKNSPNKSPRTVLTSPRARRNGDISRSESLWKEGLNDTDHFMVNSVSITKHFATISGNSNIITGDHNRITGNSNKVYGHYNIIYGNSNTVVGNHNCLYGNSNTSSGKGNSTIGSSACIPNVAVSGNNHTFFTNGFYSGSEPVLLDNNSRINELVSKTPEISEFANLVQKLRPTPISSPLVPSTIRDFGRSINSTPAQRFVDSLGSEWTSPSTVSCSFRLDTRAPSAVRNDGFEHCSRSIFSGTLPLDVGYPRDDKKETNDDMTCVVCFDNRKRVLLEQCKHLCLCSGCAAKLLSNGSLRCPVCTKLNTNCSVIYV